MEALYTLEGQASVRNFPQPVASPSLLPEELGRSCVPVTKFRREENRCLQRIPLWGFPKGGQRSSGWAEPAAPGDGKGRTHRMLAGGQGPLSLEVGAGRPG